MPRTTVALCVAKGVVSALNLVEGSTTDRLELLFPQAKISARGCDNTGKAAGES